jgi:hypothetical protein
MAAPTLKCANLILLCQAYKQTCVFVFSSKLSCKDRARASSCCGSLVYATSKCRAWFAHTCAMYHNLWAAAGEGSMVAHSSLTHQESRCKQKACSIFEHMHDTFTFIAYDTRTHSAGYLPGGAIPGTCHFRRRAVRRRRDPVPLLVPGSAACGTAMCHCSFHEVATALMCIHICHVT